MKLTITVIEFIILSLALQGLILSVMLFFSSRNLNSNRFLAAFIFVVSYSCLVTGVIISGLLNKFPMLVVEMPRLRMAIGPLLLFYTRSLLNGRKKIYRKDYFHFLALLFEMGPQVLFILYISNLVVLSWVQAIIHSAVAQFYFFGGGIITEIPFWLSIIFYSLASYKKVSNIQDSLDASAYKLKDVKWLRNILHIVLIIVVIRIVFYIVMAGWSGGIPGLDNSIMPVLTMLFAYGLGMSVYIRQVKMSAVDVEGYNKSPVKIYFSDAEANQYHGQLISLMEKEKFYLNPALKLDVLADKLAVSERVISNVLNQYIGKNFNDFINEYRVLEAKKKLADPSQMHFTIAAIAFDCGFNSLATFQRCFKQLTGTTPSQYQNNLKRDLSFQKIIVKS